MENFKYFKNEKCEYFPCHKTGDDFFNCMFCYCPLYSMGENCGGNFTINKDGGKDCSSCLLIHSEKGYDHILRKLKENK